MSTEWQARVDLDTAGPLTDDQVEGLVDGLAAHGAAVSWLGLDLSVTLTVETAHASPLGAAEVSVQLVERAVAEVGGRVTRRRGVEALVADEADSRTPEPTIPPLVGASEAAEVLGVSRQRVHQLAADNPRFPVPVVQVRMGPLWTHASIEAFDRAWTRKPGRPAAAAIVATSTLRA